MVLGTRVIANTLKFENVSLRLWLLGNKSFASPKLKSISLVAEKNERRPLCINRNNSPILTNQSNANHHQSINRYGCVPPYNWPGPRRRRRVKKQRVKLPWRRCMRRYMQIDVNNVYGYRASIDVSIYSYIRCAVLSTPSSLRRQNDLCDATICIGNIAARSRSLHSRPN